MLFHFLPVPRGVQPTSCLNGTCWKVNVLPCWHTCSTCWVSCPVFCSSCFVSQRPEVRECGKFRGRLNLFITLTGSVGGSVGDTPSFWRACFLASVCLTIRGQTIPSHNEWHSKNVPFFPLSSGYVLPSLNVELYFLLRHDQHIKGTSFALVPEQSSLIDLSQNWC